jgi:hypothetical protein
MRFYNRLTQPVLRRPVEFTTRRFGQNDGKGEQHPLEQDGPVRGQHVWASPRRGRARCSVARF